LVLTELQELNFVNGTCDVGVSYSTHINLI